MQMTHSRKHYTEKNFDPFQKAFHWLMALTCNICLVIFGTAILIAVVGTFVQFVMGLL